MVDVRRFGLSMFAASIVAVVGFVASPALAQRRGAPTATPLATAGREAFLRRCNGCHGGAEPGSSYLPQGPVPARMHVSEAEARQTVRNGSREDGMPAFSRNRVGDRELDSIIAYLRAAGDVR